MNSYVSLHNHSHYSFQDGLGNVEQWVKGAKAKKVAGLGITNHGFCGDLLEFYNLGKLLNYPIILGTEFYVINDRKNKDTKNRYGHLNLWAKNAIGYKNLCILNSLSWTEDRLYYKPRIDFEDLKQYHEGLVCGSACAGGVIAKPYLNGDEAKSIEFLIFLKDLFGEDFYLEIQPADISYNWNKDLQQFIRQYDHNPQEKLNRFYQKISKEYGIKIVATTDAHMVNKEDKKIQDIQMMTSDKKGGWCFYETYYLCTYDEFVQIFKEKHPYVFEDNAIFGYLENTFEIAGKCKDIDLKFAPLLPEVVKGANSKVLYEILENEKIIDLNNDKVKSRIDIELKTLCDNGRINLSNYFLLLYDLIKHCQKNDITVGPGRGSACGSLLCFGMGITKIDPLKYNLSFERFINEARIQENTLPDIDLDFSDPSKAKDYLFEKYGSDYVASIGTVQTLKLRLALKDTLRIMEPSLTADDVNRMTKYIDDNREGDDPKRYFLKQINKNEQLKHIMIENPEIAKTSFNLIGQARQKGTHAAAVVVSSVPLREIVPLTITNGNWVTQYSMGDVEKSGLIKYDLLGLNTLNDISYCMKLIKQNYNVDLSMEKIINEKSDDPAIFKEFEKGNTHSVFQFNTDVAISICTKVSIKSLEDLSIITALGRPGTLSVGMHEVYIKRHNKKEPVTYFHESVKDILRGTHGVMLYQEQIMQVFQKLGGFNAVETDSIRRGMAKKKQFLLDGYKISFINNVVSRYPDINKNKAEKIWQLIEANTGYSFNHAHSIAYAAIAYICQYLKTYYPLEWWCSVFKYESNNDKLAEMYHMLKDLLIMPDINLSKEHFYIKDCKIVMPLSYVMKLGDKAVKEIVAKQPYHDLKDFVKRVDRRSVRKDVVVNLILSGVFKSIEKEVDKKLIEKYYQLLADYSALTATSSRKVLEEYRDKFQHLTRFEIIKLQNNILPGCSQNYVDFFKDRLPDNTKKISQILGKKNNSKINIAGIVKKIKNSLTKTGNKMCFFTVEDGEKELPAIMWQEQVEMFENTFVENDFVDIDGKVNIWNDRLSIVVNNINKIEI